MDKKIIHTVFEEQVTIYPLHTAISMEGREISYISLNTEANRLAHLLQMIPFTADKITGVLVDHGIEQVMSMLAVFKAGCIYLPLSYDFSDARFQQIFARTLPTVLVIHKNAEVDVYALMNRIGAWVEYLIIMDDHCDFSVLHLRDMQYSSQNIHAGYLKTENPGLMSKGDDGNYIYYTSGSSGEPKAILGKHESLSHFIHWEIKEFGIDSQWRVSQLTQITFDASLRDILVPLCSGATLCIPSASVKQNLNKLIEWINTEKISLIHCVPSLFRAIIKEMLENVGTPYQFSHLNYILLAGELLYARDVMQWRLVAGSKIQLVNLYGATETTMIKMFHRIDDIPADAASVLPVGKPIDNTSVAILNGKNVCRAGEIGEIYIKTPFATKGYYGDDALTNTVFVQNPLVTDRVDIVYKTGDQGRYLKDKLVEVLGRLDDMVKVNGVRIELREIEQAVLKKDGVAQTVVKVHKNSDHQLEIICFYTGEQVTREALRAHLELMLNKSLLPAYVIQMKEFPLNANGKIDKRALTLSKAFLMNEFEFKPPVNATELALEQIWIAILGIPRVSRDISFFQIGGHSLRAVQLVSRISVEFGVDLKITDIFNHPTIQQQSKLLETAAKNDLPAIAQTKRQRYHDVSNGQLRMWLQQQQNEAANMYNIPAAYHLQGPLNIKALQSALGTIIDRHDSIRTTFAFSEAGLKQEVHDSSHFSFYGSFVDLQTDTGSVADLIQRLFEEASKPFNLEKGPLIRCKIYRNGTDDYTFLFVMHHIVCDGWSMEILFKEIISCYNAQLASPGSPLPALAFQYSDYTGWMRKNLQQHGETYRRFWKDQFDKPLPVLELPADFPRPDEQTFEASMYAFAPASGMYGQLQETALQHDVTVSNIILAALCATLFVYTRQVNMVIGTPVAGRDKREWEDIVGFFANTLPLVVRFSEDTPLEELLHIVKSTTLQVYSHQLYPFDSIVTDVNLRVDRSRNPLFDVGYHFYNIESLFDVTSLQMADGIRITEIDAGHRSVKSDICLNAVLLKQEIEFSFDYNKDLFRESTIAAMADDMMFVINMLFRSPGLPMSSLATALAAFRKREQNALREHVRIRNLQRLMKL